ncbi:MAG: hypothetical protein WC895_04945, partial [Candidatus Shapirobacteria bacterium]
MADNIGIYEITADLQASPSSSVEASVEVLGNLNFRNEDERKLYNKLLVGTAKTSELPDEPNNDTSYSVPPSWTQQHTNTNQAFVESTLSSSQHEVTSRNSFLSGVFGLENSAVPASASVFYSKQNRFQKLIYKLSASALLPGADFSENPPSKIECVDRSGSVGYFVAGSGSYRCNSIFNPAEFEIEIPEYGKIRDVKVWVNFIHDIRGGPGDCVATASNPFWFGGDGDANEYKKQGLQGVQIALRSPNVMFDNAHPLWNDERVSSFEKWPSSGLTQSFRSVPSLLKNSYLLWAGHACEDDLGMGFGVVTSSIDEVVNTTNPFAYLSGYTYGKISKVIVDDNSKTHFVLYGCGATNSLIQVSMSSSYVYSECSIDDDVISEPAFSFNKNNKNIEYMYVKGRPGSGDDTYVTFATSSSFGISTYVVRQLIDAQWLDTSRASNIEFFIDDNGRRHFTMMTSKRSDGQQFIYGWSDSATSASWHISSIDDTVELGYAKGQVNGCSLYANKNSVPELAFYDQDSELVLLTSSSLGWNKAVVDSKTSFGTASYDQFLLYSRFTPSLFIDDDDVSHVAYEKVSYSGASDMLAVVMCASTGSNGLVKEYASANKNIISVGNPNPGYEGGLLRPTMYVTKDGRKMIYYVRDRGNALINSFICVSGSEGWSTKELDTGTSLWTVLNSSKCSFDSNDNAHFTVDKGVS